MAHYTTYPVAFYSDELCQIAITVPDLPGCFSKAPTFDEALKKAKEVVESTIIELFLAGGRQAVPQSSRIIDYVSEPEYSCSFWVFVEVDLERLEQKAKEVAAKDVVDPVEILEKTKELVLNKSRKFADLAVEVNGEFLDRLTAEYNDNIYDYFFHELGEVYEALNGIFD